MRKFLLMVMLISATSISHAGVIKLEAVDAGWYNKSGHHDPMNTNYFVGQMLDWVSNTYSFHNFMVFDLSGVVGDITSATLELYSSDIVGSLTYNLYDVSTPVDVLTAGGENLVEIYDELGSGTLWGSMDLSIDQMNQFIQFQLNKDALKELNSASGLFAFGGGYEIANPMANQSAFGYSGHLQSVNLILETTSHPVPQPGSLMLLSLGLLCLLLARKNLARNQ